MPTSGKCHFPAPHLRRNELGKLIRYAAWSSKGHVRDKNQDNLYCGEGFFLEEMNNGMEEFFVGSTSPGEGSLFAVFDGMGGEKAGETAAYLAAKRMQQIDMKYSEWKKALFPERFLESFCKAASAEIDSCRKARHYDAMGTTTAAAYVQRGKVIICNVGDSRIYRYSEGEFRQVSIDHTESYCFVGNAALTQYLGIPAEEMVIEPAVSRFPYRSGDIYLLCTDGVWNCSNETVLQERLLSESNIRSKMRNLFDMVYEYGERDNATAIILELK